MDYTVRGVAKNLDKTERISLSLYTLFRFLIVLCYSVFFSSLFFSAFHFESFFCHIFKPVILSSVLWSSLISPSKVLFLRFPGVSVVEK